MSVGTVGPKNWNAHQLIADATGQVEEEEKTQDSAQESRVLPKKPKAVRRLFPLDNKIDNKSPSSSPRPPPLFQLQIN